MGFLTAHEHGKSKVRLGRTWRDAHTNTHHFVEWEVCVRLISPEMEKAYTNGDNAGMTTTDTTRNMVRFMYSYCFERAVLSPLVFIAFVACVSSRAFFSLFLSLSLSLSLSLLSTLCSTTKTVLSLLSFSRVLTVLRGRAKV